MSNWKKAYGWIGHIITNKAEGQSEAEDNVIAVTPEQFSRLVSDYQNLTLDKRIKVEQLGVTSIREVYFLACGTAFSEGFTHYGTVFGEAELRADRPELVVDLDQEYRQAMKEIYGIELPPSRIMIGCSSEH